MSKGNFYHKTESNPNAVEYLNNEEFGKMVARYNDSCTEAESLGKTIPKIPNEIAEAFIKLVTNLARSPNFSSYTETWKSEMQADAIENCIRYVRKFNIDAPTRTGKPEAFSYFTRIAYFAFLRRIKKEKTQHEIKTHLIREYNLFEEDDNGEAQAQASVEKAKQMRDCN
jgi:hypothetical protein